MGLYNLMDNEWGILFYFLRCAYHLTFLLAFSMLIYLLHSYPSGITMGNAVPPKEEGMRTLTSEASVWVDSNHHLTTLLNRICKGSPLEGANLIILVYNVMGKELSNKELFSLQDWITLGHCPLFTCFQGAL
jgi:hypothetical protein